MSKQQSYGCGMEAVLDLLDGKWKILILYHLRGSRLRFSELRRLLGPVSEKMLSQHLKEMVADGLLQRIDFGTRPLRVEYESTAFGLDLCNRMEPLCNWGEENMAAVEAIAAARGR